MADEEPVTLGEVLIRCNNVLYLRAAPNTTADTQTVIVNSEEVMDTTQ